MSHIRVEFAQLKEIERACSDASNKIIQAKLDFSRAVAKLDWEVKSKSNINSRCQKLAKRIENCSVALSDYEKFVNRAYGKYSELDRYRMNPTLGKIDGGATVSKTVENDKAESKTTKDKLTTKKEINRTGQKETEVITDSYGTAVLTKTVNEKNEQLVVSPQGVEIKVAESIYSNSEKTENEYLNTSKEFSVGAQVTKAGIKSDVIKMFTGGYVEGESYDLVNAELSTEMTGIHFGVAASGSIGGVIGASVDMEADIGKIEGDIHGKIGIDEKGNPVVDVGAKAMVTAVQGEITSSVSVGDIKAESTIKGYAGSIGVEAGINYDGDKITINLGASFGVGAGVEVTIEPTGKLKEAIDYYNNLVSEAKNVFKYGLGYTGHLFGFW